MLHQVVRGHLETFLAEARLRGGGEGLPRFVERELREFLTCGVLAEGFARFRCTDCQHEILVAFSCKGRFCPSCCGRRMAEQAAHLVDGVLGGLPVRQWVLTLPYRLRYALAWDHRLCRAVLSLDQIRSWKLEIRNKTQTTTRAISETELLRFGLAENRTKDPRQLGRFLDQGIALTGGGRIIADVYQAKPIPCLLCFLAADLDSQGEVPFAYGFIGLDVVRPHGARGSCQLPSILGVGEGSRERLEKCPHASSEGKRSVFQVIWVCYRRVSLLYI